MKPTWDFRLANYIASCIDGGWSIKHLTIRKLVQVRERASAQRPSGLAAGSVPHVAGACLCARARLLLPA
jgi:hypothetical protein